MSRWPVLAVVLALAGALAARVAAAPPEGELTYAMHVTLTPAWFDPAENTGIATPFMVQEALHDALVKPMPQSLMAPSLAESWTESPDGLRYEFVLRRGVVFHDGEPLTAEDVRFSFERYRGAAAKLLKEKVRAVEVAGPHRVRFVLHEPWPDFLTFYATPATGAAWIVPKKYVEKVGEAGFKKHPIGAGPYKFVSHQPGVVLILEAHEKYWRKTPHIKRLVMKVVPEEPTRLAATHVENYLVTGGTYASGGHVDIDDLFQQQARELDRTKRQALLQRIQRLAYERVLFLPIYALYFNNGVGPRVRESSLGRIPLHYYTAPFEDMRLRTN